ncbi:hypothetical protein EIP86_004642 [Pleurotus ostreatoroseus]|nr:hypothetical protein EIP86_004642 [Pleurotus ostreatoroseus]
MMMGYRLIFLPCYGGNHRHDGAALLRVESEVGGIGTAIAIHFVPEFTQFQKFQVVVIVWLICAAVCDATITIALTWHLRRHKTGFQGTDDVLNKIIRCKSFIP